MSTAFITKDDDVIVDLNSVFTGDAMRFYREHMGADEEQKYPEVTPNHRKIEAKPKSPYSYVEPRTIKVDKMTRVAVFKNEAGDVLTYDDNHNHFYNRYNKRDVPHPDNPDYKYVGTVQRLDRVESKIHFPFFVSRTKAYFTHGRSLTDVRDQDSVASYMDPKELPGYDEEADDEEFLCFIHDRERGYSNWVSKHIKLDIEL